MACTCKFKSPTQTLPIQNKNSDVLVIFDTPSKDNNYNFTYSINKIFKKFNLREHNLICLSRCIKLNERGKLDDYTDKELKECAIKTKYFIQNNPNIKYVLCLGANSGKIFMKPEVDGEVAGKYVEKKGILYYTTYNPVDIIDRKWLKSKFESNIGRFFNTFYKNKGLRKPEIKISTIKNDKDLEDLEAKFEKLEKKYAPMFAFDIETNGLDAFKKGFKVLTISFSFDEKSAFVIPVDHRENSYNIDRTKLKEFLNRIFNNKKLLGVAHNAKFDIIGLTEYFKITITNLGFDTQLIWHTLFNEDKKGLKDIVYKLTDYGGYENDIHKYLEKGNTFENIPLEKLLKYNGYDTALTYMVMLKEIPLIDKRQAQTLCWEFYPKASDAFTEMERTGMNINEEKLLAYKMEYLKKVKYFELKLNNYPEIKQAMRILGISSFNPNSSDHLQCLFFKVLNLRQVTDKTAGTDKDSIKLYMRQCNNPLLKDLLEYSPIFKLYSTYLSKVKEKWIKDDGLSHTNFNLVGTANGRPSSNEPNFLNLPRASWYKSLFRPFDPKNYIFIHADYSQMELRVLASYSLDKLMVEIFNNKKDPHTMTAANVFDILEDAVTKIQRQIAKGINFGLAYGMGADGLAQKLTLELGRNVSVEEAEEYILAYQLKFSGNTEFIRTIMQSVADKGFIKNIFGRVRHLEKGKFGDRDAKREGINGLIQGTAGDILLGSLGNFYEWKIKNNIDAYLTLSVYDSTLVAVRKDLNTIKLVAEKLHYFLINPPHNCMRVPIEADVEIGEDYGYLYKFNYNENYFEIKKEDIPKNFEELRKYIIAEDEKKYKINVKYFLDK